MSLIAINGKVVKAPNEYNISYEPITDAERLVDTGDMVITGIAGKAKFQYKYNSTYSKDLKPFFDMWKEYKTTKKIKNTITVYEPFGENSYTVYFSPIAVNLVKKGITSEYDIWDVSFSFVEV